jgi:5-(carboxyamino)imidazole ribonucleotide synthase
MKMVGILGGGQLARMMALSGHSLGLGFRIFDPSPDASAAAVAEHVCAPWDDPEAIARFCDGLDVATLELEALPLATARAVAAQVPLRPSPRALAAAQDRLAEKELARSLGLSTAPFVRIDTEADLVAALGRVGAPALLKHRTEGYDGRGQAVVREADAAVEAFRAGGGRPSVLEGFVRFDRELSLVAVRGLHGEVACYPLVENLHEGGVLRRTIAPAPRGTAALADEALEAARLVLEALDYVGVLTLEFFECGGRLLVNEIAPRVHNSGHWTIEGAVTSQFENHLRAVLGLPLGSTEPRGWSLLRNILGHAPEAARVLAIPDAHLHLYGKEPRAGRKLGHVTICASSLDVLEENGRALHEVLGGEGVLGGKGALGGEGAIGGESR